MDDKIKHLISVGAAAAVNCRPCLEYHVPRCTKAGASEDEVRDAIETGFQGNRGALAKTQGYVEDVIADARHDIDGPTPECCDKETAKQTGCC